MSHLSDDSTLRQARWATSPVTSAMCEVPSMIQRLSVLPWLVVALAIGLVGVARMGFASSDAGEAVASGARTAQFSSSSDWLIGRRTERADDALHWPLAAAIRSVFGNHAGLAILTVASLVLVCTVCLFAALICLTMTSVALILAVMARFALICLSD